MNDQIMVKVEVKNNFIVQIKSKGRHKLMNSSYSLIKRASGMRCATEIESIARIAKKEYYLSQLLKLLKFNGRLIN